MTKRIKQARSSGFTLIEMVIAIAIGAIVVAVAAAMISSPVDSYMAQSRMVQTVDAADHFRRGLSDDAREALPNSFRWGNFANIKVLQMMVTQAVLTYEDQIDAPIQPASQTLDFTIPDSQFYVFGGMPALTNGMYLVIDNSAVDANHDAYQSSTNVIPASRVSLVLNQGTDVDQLTLAPGFQFATSSAGRKLYVVTPVTYICDDTAQTLTRYSFHSISAAIPANSAAPALHTAGSRTELMATGVTNCNITCQPGPGRCASTAPAKLEADVIRGVAPNTTLIHVVQSLATEMTP